MQVEKQDTYQPLYENQNPNMKHPSSYHTPTFVNETQTQTNLVNFLFF